MQEMNAKIIQGYKFSQKYRCDSSTWVSNIIRPDTKAIRYYPEVVMYFLSFITFLHKVSAVFSLSRPST